MAATPVDFFRVGNATSAKLEALRPGIDIVTETRSGQEWVRAGSGGASTFDVPNGVRGKHWWKLPAGATYDEKRLTVWNDYPTHWVWEATTDMPLADLISALSQINSNFVHC